MIAIEEIPEALRKHVYDTTPMPMRMLAAKGVAPLPPRDLVIVQAVLAAGEDVAVATAASESLGKLPDAILTPILSGDVPSFVLHRLSDLVLDKPALLELVLLNRALSDAHLAAIVARLPEAALPLALQNEERLLRSEPLVLALRAHPQISPAQIDRMVDFLVRAGIVVEGVPEFAAALMRLSPAEALEAIKNVEVPDDLIADKADSAIAPDGASLDDLPDISAELVTEADPAAIAEPEAKKKDLPLLGRIMKMTIAQKIAVAMKGNKEVRSMLVRDTNKLVAIAAIKNPRMTDSEVATVAASRSVHDEVIRTISMNGQWLRQYSVKLALVGNPKTPLPIAMKFLPLLKAIDVKNIAKSKNVSSAVANQAKIIQQKQRQ